MEELFEKLKRLGVDPDKTEYVFPGDYEEYVKALKAFMDSYDFMGLGQAVSRKQWQAAAMKISKMTNLAKKYGVSCFELPFTGIRQAVNRRNDRDALQALTVVTTKRIRIRECLKQGL